MEDASWLGGWASELSVRSKMKGIILNEFLGLDGLCLSVEIISDVDWSDQMILIDLFINLIQLIDQIK